MTFFLYLSQMKYAIKVVVCLAITSILTRTRTNFYQIRIPEQERDMKKKSHRVLL